MVNIRTVLAAVALALPAVWAIASIGADSGVEMVSQATPAQVDAFALMSTSRRLPTHKYDTY